MSMQLSLIFEDNQGRWVDAIELMPYSSTKTTKDCLYDETNRPVPFEETKRRYLKWVKEKYNDELCEDTRKEINDLVAYWGDTYTPRFIEM